MPRQGAKKPASEAVPPAAAEPAAPPPPAAVGAAPPPPPLDTADLAKGILARTIRPRVADIRRLAEAVLAGTSKPDKKKKKKKAAKKAERKLSKIPGQKAGK